MREGNPELLRNERMVPRNTRTSDGGASEILRRLERASDFLAKIERNNSEHRSYGEGKSNFTKTLEPVSDRISSEMSCVN